MLKQGQRTRAIKDDTTRPTVFKVIQSQTFMDDETVLTHVDGFINSHPSNNIPSTASELASAGSSYSGINPTVLSQLNRLQRSLRGLPPLFEEETVTAAASAEPNSIEEPVNKKIVFD